MTEQSEALRLAEWIEQEMFCQADAEIAAELRRLHSENIAAVSSFLSADDERIKLRAQRDELLEALKVARSIIGHPDDAHSQLIDAAIAKVEGKK